jgi:drug/metabolite transporter (DMT)-like permease
MLKSLQKNKKGILLMIVSSFCVCVGQLLWKLIPSFGILCLLGGFALYGLGALIMLVAYRYGSLSVLQPVISLNYAISAILATTILGETMNLVKVTGIIVITIGVVMIAGGD